MGSYPLLVIFHDPPTFQDNPDPVTGKRELHNTWLVSQYSSLVLFSLTLHTKTDVTKKYIDWAVDSGFQVIDVNIPKVVFVEHVSHPEAIIGGLLTSFSLTQATCGPTTLQHGLCRPVSLRHIFGTITLSKWMSPTWRFQLAKRMNRPYDATQVFFMGIGDAYLGLVDLLSTYGKYRPLFEIVQADLPEQCTEPDGIVELLIGFVAETTIQSIKRTTDDTIANWYYTVSPPLPSPDKSH
jgi:histone deacetylase 6